MCCCLILCYNFQASESEVLQALIRWGEHQLKSNKNSKRREVCDGELKDLLADLISMVRVPHVLPRDRTSEVLDMALGRNLFAVLPNFTSQVNAATKYSPWDPKSNNGLFVR